MTVSGERESTFFADLAVSTALVVFFMAIAALKAERPDLLPWLLPDRSFHLGAEHKNVASAVTSGRGFSDPFNIGTGPTAWTTPVVSGLLALAFFLVGDVETVVADLARYLQGGGSVFAVFTGIRFARSINQLFAGVVISLLFLTANFRELFQSTHDTGVLLVETTLLWIVLCRFRSKALSTSFSILWGLFGGVVALSSPVMGGTWAVVTLLLYRPIRGRVAASLFRRFKIDLPRIRYLAFAVGSSVLVVTPWTVRCWYALDALVPIKSNGGFELWQSQCVDDDGVMDSTTMWNHPWHPPWSLAGAKERAAYVSDGEIAYVEAKQELAIRSILRDPLEAGERVVRRFFAACLVYQPFQESELDAGYGLPLAFKRFLHPWPFAATIVYIAFQKHRDRRVAFAASIYLVTLAPYVLISYYDRYAAPLVGMKIVLTTYICAWGKHKWEALR